MRSVMNCLKYPLGVFELPSWGASSCFPLNLVSLGGSNDSFVQTGSVVSSAASSSTSLGVMSSSCRSMRSARGILSCRHVIFPLIGGFPPIERSHRSFLRSVQIRWENYRVYLTCERFSKSNFANLPRALISFLHGTLLNVVNLFCFGHDQSVHGLTESTTKGSNAIVTCKSAV